MWSGYVKHFLWTLSFFSFASTCTLQGGSFQRHLPGFIAIIVVIHIYDIIHNGRPVYSGYKGILPIISNESCIANRIN